MKLRKKRSWLACAGMLFACIMTFMSAVFADLPCDVDASGAVDAVDVQLVINGALRLDTWPYSTDVDSSGATDAMDVQLAINAALRLPVVLPPRVTVFTLGQVVVDPVVTLNNVCTGNPTHYMASESPSFSGASWQTYSAAPSFTLSSGNGVKTVYFKVKNGAGESAAVSDTITLNEPEETILLSGEVPLEMVWIPGGTFMMGRYPGEQESSSIEDPQRQVTLPGFWMAKHELTKRQWVAVMGTTPWSGEDYVLDDLDSPAVYVSWDDAKSFITALNGLTGKTFRLPSESEWEYACRAGTITRFYWGDDPDYAVGNAYCWWTYNAWDVNEGYAHVVGLKLPNTFGLYDMHGNVWEWCEDDWHWGYSGAPTDGSAWVDSPRGSLRMVRGGGWGDGGSYCRSARRFSNIPSDAYGTGGFRLCR